MPSLSFRITFGTNTELIQNTLWQIAQWIVIAVWGYIYLISYNTLINWHVFLRESLYPPFFFKLKTDKPCELRLIVWFKEFKTYFLFWIQTNDFCEFSLLYGSIRRQQTALWKLSWEEQLYVDEKWYWGHQDVRKVIHPFITLTLKLDKFLENSFLHKVLSR